MKGHHHTMQRTSARTAASLAGAALLAATALAACGSSSAATSSSGGGGSSSNVTLRVGDQEQRLQTLLQASGESKGLGYKISWADFASGPPMLQAVEAGSLDVGSVGDTPPIFAAAAGGPGANIRIVGASRTVGGDTDTIIVAKNSKIHSLAQLKGKKIAVTRGSSAQLALLLALQKAGLTWKDITPVYLEPTDAQPAFAAGSVDAWVVWYPFVSVATANSGRVLASATDLDPGYSFLVSDTASTDNAATSKALGDFVHRVALADHWALTHVAQWSKLFAGISGLPSAEATDTVEHNLAVAVPVDGAVAAAEQQAADGFASAGLISRVDVAKVVDGQYDAQLTAAGG
jgi:sulfonate transport system substrate-binding protein